MARTEYNNALAVQGFVQWAKTQPGIVDTDALENDLNLPDLVTRYTDGGGEIPAGLKTPLSTVRMVLDLARTCTTPADDTTFGDLERQLEELLADYRSVLPPGDPDSTMKVDPRRARLLGLPVRDENDE